MFKLIRQSVLSTLCLAVLLCAAYPMLVTGAADAFFPCLLYTSDAADEL